MTVNDYALAADVQTVLSNLDLSGSATNGQPYSAILTPLITRASRAIDKFTGRKPGAFYVNADVIRYFDGPATGIYNVAQGSYQDNRLHGGGSQYATLWIDELAVAPTEVAVAETGNVSTYTVWPSTDYFLLPYNAADDGLPYLRLDLDILYGTHRTWLGFHKSIRITGKFGFSVTPPADVQMATVIQATRWLKRGMLAFADSSAVVPTPGGNQSPLTYTERLDNDLEKLLVYYRRQGI